MHRRRIRDASTLAIALALLAFSPALWAQTAPESEQGAQGESEAVEELVPIEELDLESLLSTLVVEAASRREQSIHDAPSAISVITAEQIESMGVTNVAEILRRVVAVWVMQTAENNYNVGIRGFNTLINNRVLVLIDGRVLQEPATGLAPWGWLPFNPAEIQRIEVIRGPGTTLYGSNAFSGVINIVTKRPIDHPGVSGQAQAGLHFIQEGASDQARSSSMVNSGSGYGAYSWVNDEQTFGARLSLGFDLWPEWSRTVEEGEYLHGPFNYHASLSLDSRPNEDLTAFAALSHVLAEPRTDTSELMVPTPFLQSEQSFLLNVTRENYLDGAMTLRAIFDGQHQGLETESVDSNNYRAHGLLLTDFTVWEERNVLTLGVEGSYVDIQDYFDYSPRANSFSVMAQNDTELLESRSLLVSLGVRYERVGMDDRQGTDVVYQNVNPRGALIWRFEEDHDLRLSAATAYRTPTAFQTFIGAVRSVYPEPIPPVAFQLPNSALHPERSESVEVGYRGEIADMIRLDTAVFLQRLIGIIRQPLVLQQPLTYENSRSFNQIGLEIGIELALSDRFSGYLNYAFVRSVDDESGDVVHEWPSHLGGVGLDYLIPGELSLHLDTTVVGQLERTGFYGTLAESTIETRSQPTNIDINFKLGRPVFGDRGEVFFVVRNLLGFSDQFDRLVQYPSDTSTPIGATVMVGASIAEF